MFRRGVVLAKRELIATVASIIGIFSIIVTVFIFSFNSRFQGLEDSIDALDSRCQGLQDSIGSLRIGLNDQMDALRSDFERIEKILAVLEQRMDINTKEVGNVNQLLDSILGRITDIEQALNQSEPPPPFPPQSVSLVIFYPQMGDEVDWTTSVTGNSTGIATNKTLDLYLLVYPVESEGPWFVQNRPTINLDGSWSGLVYFGRNPDTHPEDIGDQFVLSAIVTTANLQPGETFTEIPESIHQCLISGIVRK